MNALPGEDALERGLLRAGAVNAAQLDAARLEQARLVLRGEHVPLSQILIRNGVINAEKLGEIERSLHPGSRPAQTFGSFIVLKKLGEGGMGAVYLAEDPATGQKVALKILPKKHAGNAVYLSRFKREADSATRLKHMNVVAAIARGEEKGRHFFTMEYCDGEALDKQLKREERLPWKMAVEVALHVARGLQHAHDHHIIHRDIKPSNIFMTLNGVAKILDLGLAKNIAETEPSFATTSGAAIGTAHYISPEQAMGEKGIDGRTDIYSLGAMLFHLITGTTPFQGTTPAAIMLKHLNEPLTDPRRFADDIPESLVRVIRKMMAKAVADRYPDCAELIVDLEQILAGNPPLHADIQSPEKIARSELIRENAAEKPKRFRLWTMLYAAAALACAAALILAVSPSARSPDLPPNPTATAPSVIPAIEPAPVIVERDVFMDEVRALPAEAQAKWVSEEMKRLNPKMGNCEYKIKDNKVYDFFCPAVYVSTVSPVRALVDLEAFRCQSSNMHLNSLTDLSPLKHLKLKHLDVQGTSVTDISVVKEMPLEQLFAADCPLVDLSALAGKKMRGLHCSMTRMEAIPLMDYSAVDRLDISQTRVADLAPARQMPKLRQLDFSGTPITDLSPLAGSPVNMLRFGDCNTAGIAALKTCPNLQELYFDLNLQRDVADLRSMSGLQKINDLTRNEFFAKADQGNDASKNDAAWQDAIDFKPLVDCQRDALFEGTWSRVGTDIKGVAPFRMRAMLSLPYKVPAEYDFRIVFTRVHAQNSLVLQVISSEATNCALKIAGRTVFGNGPRAVTRWTPIGSGFTYESVVKVRKGGVQVFLDGEQVLEFRGDIARDMKDETFTRLRNPDRLAVGIEQNEIVFHRIQVRDISGKGVFVRPATMTTIEGAK